MSDDALSSMIISTDCRGNKFYTQFSFAVTVNYFHTI